MRWPWLRALVLGLWLGPAEAADLESPALDLAARPVAARDTGAGSAPASPEEGQWIAELWSGPASGSEWERWQSLALRTAAHPSLLTDAIEAEIASWRGIVSSHRPLTPLGCALCLLPSLDRTALVSSWATSSDAATRETLARALAAPFDAVGVRTALALLRTDPLPRVRALAEESASTRRAGGAAGATASTRSARFWSP